MRLNVVSSTIIQIYLHHLIVQILRYELTVLKSQAPTVRFPVLGLHNHMHRYIFIIILKFQVPVHMDRHIFIDTLKFHVPENWFVNYDIRLRAGPQARACCV